MPKNKNKNEETKIEPVKTEPEAPAESPASTNTVLLVIVIVLLFIIVISGLCVGGWYFWQSKKEQKIKQLESQVQTQASDTRKNENQVANNLQEQGLVYENKDFGYRLNFTPSWEKYRAEGGTMGGDFEVSRMCFFLPTKYDNYTGELPEYTSPFCISAFVAYSWDEEEKRNSAGLGPMGEVVGRNGKYVFVYSHFNGDMPPDVPQQAILDMPKIAEGIEIFEPSGAATDTSNQGNLNKGTRPVAETGYASSAVYYWNCKHRYTLNYPTVWSNNGMTYNSNLVILRGKNLEVRVEAVPITTTETLDSFVAKRSAKIVGDEVWQEGIDWSDESFVVQVTFRNPDSQALFWLAGSYAIEMKISGTGYNNEYTNVQNMLATLTPNVLVSACSASVSETTSKTVTTVPVSNKCTYPNGDAVDWWCQVSEKERDCYEEKYGDPEGVSDKDCVKTTNSKDDECNYPKGDVEDWWDDATDYAKECFIDDGGMPP
ncbi:MAG: hypothetical protein V1690_01515, partial [Candidatus Moraniibacteriota bacterium]